MTPFDIPVCYLTEPHEQHSRTLPGGVQWTCFGEGKRGNQVPEGLTPQEIRTRLAEAILSRKRDPVFPDEMIRDLNPIATWAEHGSGSAFDYPRVYDKALKTITEVSQQRDEAQTELLEAHADLEASLAREQIAQERVAEVLARLNRAESPDYALEDDLRAILAGDQGEEACDCHDANGNLTLDVDEEARADG